MNIPCPVIILESEQARIGELLKALREGFVCTAFKLELGCGDQGQCFVTPENSSPAQREDLETRREQLVIEL